MNTILFVIAYPPPSNKLMFWKAHKPFMLALNECSIDNLNGTAKIYKPKKGYVYRLASLIDSECI